MSFIKFGATYFYENCLCYGINQDQTEKLPSVGIDTRRQYCATWNREGHVIVTS